MSGGRFFLFWMLAFLGFPLGGLLAVLVVGSIEGVFSAVLAGALAGAVIGAARFLALRGRLGGAPSGFWRPRCLAVGNAAGTALTGAGTGIGALIVAGVAADAAVGTSQWTLLRQLEAAILWPPVVAAAWTWSAVTSCSAPAGRWFSRRSQG